ncbi:MAG TPA: hypothetical protein VGH28_04590 [Polyangiaceae bacterium]|jgi:hypothetical protein
MIARVAFAASCVALLACSSDDTAATDAGADQDAGLAPPPAAPQVQNQGGSIFASPRVVPIFFANDPAQSQIEDFLKQLAASTYWSATTSEYGVGALAIASSIVATDAAPAKLDTESIETWLAPYATGHGANDVFAIFYPASTTLTDPRFGTSCADFNGFHDQGLADGSIVYAVLPRCPSAGALTGFDALSASASHELVEAATDPFVETQPAWSFTDIDHLIWSFLPGAEVADMCDLEPSSFQRIVGPYVVQRSWSNASARAGHDPCVPALANPYFNAAPNVTSPQQITFESKVLTTEGLGIPLGESKTIAVRLFSDGPTAGWSVDAIDTEQPPSFTFAWDAQTGNDGDTLHLTITRTSKASSEIAIESHAGTTTNYWFEYVTP